MTRGVALLGLGYVLSQFFRASVQQPDVRVEALYYLTIHLHHDT